MTRTERAARMRRMVTAYQDGHSTRKVAELFGMSRSHVGDVMRLYGVQRRVGRPTG